MRDQVIACNEILGAMLGAGLGAGVEDAQAITDDPKGYIKTKVGVNINDAVTLNVVANKENTVALALPYYGSLAGSTAKMLDDAQIEMIVGACGVINIYGEYFDEPMQRTLSSRRDSNTVEQCCNEPQGGK